MSIIAKPMQKSQKEVAKLPPEMKKAANSVLSAKMPTIFMAYREGAEDEIAAVGFRYRRQSHSCELTWWCGRDEELIEAALQACIAQFIVEGRKRTEVFVEENWAELDEEPEYHHPHKRGGEQFCQALEKAGFTYEGRHRFFTKYLEDVKVYSWVTLLEGLPEIAEGTKLFVARNETTDKYREKNIELYKKDRDYYSYTSGGESGKTFAEILQEHYDWVENHPSIEIIEDWTSKV